MCREGIWGHWDSGAGVGVELTSRARQQLVQDLWGQGSGTLAKV